MFPPRQARCVSLVLLIVLALAPSSAAAHPGTGIVVDRLGQVYFVDMVAGVWKVDTRGALTRIPGNGFHWMSLDADGRFAATSLPSGNAGDIVRLAAMPSLLLSSDFPMAMGVSRAGVLSTILAHVVIAGCASPLLRGLDVDAGDTIYVAATGCGRVLKVTPGGGITVMARSSGSWAPTGVAVCGHTVYVLEFEHPDTDDRREMLPRIRKITPDGKSVVIATVTAH